MYVCKQCFKLSTLAVGVGRRAWGVGDYTIAAFFLLCTHYRQAVPEPLGFGPQISEEPKDYHDQSRLS